MAEERKTLMDRIRNMKLAALISLGVTILPTTGCVAENTSNSEGSKVEKKERASKSFQDYANSSNISPDQLRESLSEAGYSFDGSISSFDHFAITETLENIYDGSGKNVGCYSVQRVYDGKGGHSDKAIGNVTIESGNEELAQILQSLSFKLKKSYEYECDNSKSIGENISAKCRIENEALRHDYRRGTR